jgi:putative component of toxin-antitoxin plasmid stabilization module
VLPELTHYLLRNRLVHIPGVGSFAVRQQPAELDFASKLLYPPTFSIDYSEDGGVPGDQIPFLARQLDVQESVARDRMAAWSDELGRHLRQQDFRWKGVGVLHWDGGKISFHPETVPVRGLQPLPAAKVLREQQVHTVQIGDQEVQAGGVPETAVEEGPATRRPYAVWAGWILLVLCLAFIAWYLLQSSEQRPSAGLQQKPDIETPGPRYK